MKRILVCGSTAVDFAALVEAALDDEWRASPAGVCVIHSGAGGVAAAANAWAWGMRAMGKGVAVKAFLRTPGEYRERDFQSNHLRMFRAGKPDMVLALPGGVERDHVVAVADSRGVPVVQVGELAVGARG